MPDNHRIFPTLTVERNLAMALNRALPRALLMHPRLVLLDEPSQGLAPRIVEDIMAVVEEMRAEGIAIHESRAADLEANAALKHRLLAV